MTRWLLTIITLIALTGVVLATTIEVESSSFNTYTDIEIKADVFPLGLSGYSGTITVADPAVAEIISVTYPSWAIIHNTGTLPAGSVSVEAIDTWYSVQSGDSDVVIATARLHGLTSGSTSTSISFSSMDDDFGSAVSPSTTSGTTTVAEMQGLHFSGAAAPTTVPVTVGQYYQEIKGSNLSWESAIFPVVPEPIIDFIMPIGDETLAYQVFWLGILGVLFAIMFGRQKNVMIVLEVGLLLFFFMYQRIPVEQRPIMIAILCIMATGMIFYWFVTRKD